jgi:putative hemolysin
VYIIIMSKNKKTPRILAVFGILLCVAVGLSITTGLANAIMNPAAVYCTSLGYEYVIESTEEGQRGFCKLPDNQTVDAVDFLRGEVALNWSYCAKMGYAAKHVEDSEICKSCTVCVLPDGTEVEVTELMGLSFEEGRCGDGTCGFPENYLTCPADCPSGSVDEYCDGVKDGICDPDCEPGEDPDCRAPIPSLLPIVLAAIVIIAVITVLAILLKRRKKES